MLIDRETGQPEDLMLIDRNTGAEINGWDHISAAGSQAHGPMLERLEALEARRQLRERSTELETLRRKK
jgi:hypothetical protein